MAEQPLTTKDEIHRFLEPREVQQVAVCKALAEDRLPRLSLTKDGAEPNLNASESFSRFPAALSL